MTGSASLPPSAGGGRPSEALGIHVQRVLPLAQSVLWHPTGPGAGPRRPPSGPYPVFIEQKAIGAVSAHYEAAGRQGMIGFLVGDLFECPTSSVRYVVIDSTIRLNQAVYGDKTLVIVSRLWERVQDELSKTEGHLIGWYHSHPPLAVELAPGDVETHLQYFKRSWHVALVLGSEHEGPVAGLFRPAPGETASTVSLPFYELIESDEGFVGGKKQSVLSWINYLTDDAAVVHAEAREAPVTPPPPVRSTVEVVRPHAPRPAPSPSVAHPSPVVETPPSSPPVPAPLPPAPPPGRPSPVPEPSLVAPLAAERRSFEDVSAGSERDRRPTQMKPPPNALSNLPLLAAGGFDIGEVETRESDPGVMLPRPQPHPPAVPRRTHTPKPFAPALAPKKRGGTAGFFATLLLLLAGGGAAGWYFFVRQPMVEGASPNPGPAESTSTAGVTPPSLSAPVPSDSSLLVFDHVADSVTLAVRGYGDRVKLFGAHQLDCSGLAQGLVQVEELWTSYNVGKRRAPPLDAGRSTRDQNLYASVDSVERHFDRSGCERP